MPMSKTEWDALSLWRIIDVQSDHRGYPIRITVFRKGIKRAFHVREVRS